MARARRSRSRRRTRIRSRSPRPDLTAAAAGARRFVACEFSNLSRAGSESLPCFSLRELRTSRERGRALIGIRVSSGDHRRASGRVRVRLVARGASGNEAMPGYRSDQCRRFTRCSRNGKTCEFSTLTILRRLRATYARLQPNRSGPGVPGRLLLNGTEGPDKLGERPIPDTPLRKDGARLPAWGQGRSGDLQEVRAACCGTRLAGGRGKHGWDGL